MEITIFLLILLSVFILYFVVFKHDYLKFKYSLENIKNDTQDSTSKTKKCYKCGIDCTSSPTYRKKKVYCKYCYDYLQFLYGKYTPSIKHICKNK